MFLLLLFLGSSQKHSLDILTKNCLLLLSSTPATLSLFLASHRSISLLRITMDEDTYNPNNIDVVVAISTALGQYVLDNHAAILVNPTEALAAGVDQVIRLVLTAMGNGDITARQALPLRNFLCNKRSLTNAFVQNAETMLLRNVERGTNLDFPQAAILAIMAHFTRHGTPNLYPPVVNIIGEFVLAAREG